MKHALLLMTAAALLATVPVGCADDGQPLAETPQRGVRIDLVFGDVEVTAVNFDVTCEDGLELSGRFNVNDDLDPPIWSVVMHLPVGDCSITLTAGDLDEEPFCSGSSDFSVLENETVKVNVVLTCFIDPQDPLGDVDVDAERPGNPDAATVFPQELVVD